MRITQRLKGKWYPADEPGHPGSSYFKMKNFESLNVICDII